MGQMALQLKQRIDTILWQRKEIEVILASMLEGVIAVDREERVIRLNPAAARMFGYSPLDSQGKNIEEVFRNPKLHDFVRDTLESAEPLERDINIASGEERFLTAHGTQLQDGEARKVGALIVLNDVTRLKRLENMRRDFVANVSHEIKTPITAIKGFAETLSSGTVKEKEDVARFLAIIEKHANRLQAIVEDLLSLSRIEQQQEKQDIDFSETVLKDVLLTAIQICQPGAETRQIKIELSCPDDLSAEINSPLLEQALVNLLDNAIKYSYEKGCVRLEVSEGKEDAVIRARDEGYGIAKKDLPCLFERFYRVDQGRSRRMGGTGLGLAIVKHISEAHGGWLTVESEIGQGSTFAIHLPKLQKRRNIGARAADLRAGERLEKGRFWV
jgi:two-component system phosphate regulon sensor histidine kinase PhoR